MSVPPSESFPDPHLPQYAPPYAPAPVQDPGSGFRTMSVVGLVLAIIPCVSLVGLVLSIVALVKSRGSADSGTRTMAIIGTVVGALWVVAAVVFGVTILHTVSVCREYGNGVHYIDGVTYTCNF